MGLLLAAALAAHIQTGGDLLNVCRSDAPTCDAFIQASARRYDDHLELCLRDHSPEHIRAAVLRHVDSASQNPVLLVRVAIGDNLCPAYDDDSNAE